MTSAILGASLTQIVLGMVAMFLALSVGIQVLQEMWRTSRGRILVNDLHRHPVARAAIWILSRLFSKSVMVKHDGPASVRRAFRPADLQEIARHAGVQAVVYRSFPFRLVLVGTK